LSNQKVINLSVIGATGSVGAAVLRICRLFPNKFHIHSLCAHKNVKKMQVISAEFHPEKVLMTEQTAAEELREIADGPFQILGGLDCLNDLVTDDKVDQVVFASSGTDAIPALQDALVADKDISLANKESIVVAGPWVMPLIGRNDQMRPLDSEHNAIWQCLKGEDPARVQKVYLTASGGPFRKLSLEELEQVTPAMAIQHPVWRMGSKISVDSSTLMNKGIELIEAMNLFGLSSSQVGALIHPGSFIHGMVEFTDLTFKMLASCPDMSLPAANAMAFPERLIINDGSFKRYAPAGGDLCFEIPDTTRFPCLKLAMEAASMGGPYPILLVGADEIAVESFLNGRIPFMQIAAVIREVMESWNGKSPNSLEDALHLLDWGRIQAKSVVSARKR